MAFKSVALGCSKDYGVSWAQKGRILTLGDKPVLPAWSGTGDQVVKGTNFLRVYRIKGIYNGYT